ncbi:hypothetical protein JCM11491_002047 [Sporobolomyces phaffii]
MSSRASPIPPDTFERPSSPSPSLRSHTSESLATSTASPFTPVILPRTSHVRPIVRREVARGAGDHGVQRPTLPVGEIAKKDDEWETASVSTQGGRAEDNVEDRRFHPRLRDLRLPRPNVRKPELAKSTPDDDRQGELDRKTPMTPKTAPQTDEESSARAAEQLGGKLADEVRNDQSASSLRVWTARFLTLSTRD